MAVSITRTADLTGVTSVANVSLFSTVDIGAAASDRTIYLCVANEVAQTADSATIDYGAGEKTMAATTGAVLASQHARIFWLHVPTGTTADIRVTWSGAVTDTQSHAAVYRALDARLSALNNSGVVNDTDADPITTASITIPANGGCIAVCSDGNAATARTWTGITEDLDVNTTVFRFSTGFSTTAGATTITVSGGNNEDAALSWVFLEQNHDGVAAASGTGSSSVVGASIAAADAAASGIGSSSVVGEQAANPSRVIVSWLELFADIALPEGAAAASGTGTASATGASIAAADGAASGTGSSSVVGAQIAAADASATGTGSSSVVGAQIAEATASATGTGASSIVGAQTAESTAAATGTGTASATGAQIAAAEGSASGAGSSNVQAESTAARVIVSWLELEAVEGTTAGSVASATGAGAASATGASIAAATAAASGTGAASATGAQIAAAEGAASGTGAASAQSEQGAAVGSASGTGEASAAGAQIAAATASASGTGAADGTGSRVESGVGSASGTGAASAEGAAETGIQDSVGNASGTGSAAAVGSFTARRITTSTWVARTWPSRPQADEPKRPKADQPVRPSAQTIARRKQG